MNSINCELCESNNDVSNYNIEESSQGIYNTTIKLCKVCNDQINNLDLKSNHFRCLGNSMWSENPAVKVLSYRLLQKLSNNQWSQDLLDMIYLEDDLLSWARTNSQDESIMHYDTNGVLLESGNNVTLIKDLNVKGANFIAKRGTTVKKITLDPYNSEYIEGRVNGQKIVILTKYVKKAK